MCSWDQSRRLPCGEVMVSRGENLPHAQYRYRLVVNCPCRFGLRHGRVMHLNWMTPTAIPKKTINYATAEAVSKDGGICDNVWTRVLVNYLEFHEQCWLPLQGPRGNIILLTAIRYCVVQIPLVDIAARVFQKTCSSIVL